MLEERLLLEDTLELGHDDPIRVTQLHCSHDSFLVCSQSRLELFLPHLCQLAELEGELLALLEENLFIHVFLS